MFLGTMISAISIGVILVHFFTQENNEEAGMLYCICLESRWCPVIELIPDQDCWQSHKLDDGRMCALYLFMLALSSIIEPFSITTAPYFPMGIWWQQIYTYSYYLKTWFSDFRCYFAANKQLLCCWSLAIILLYYSIDGYFC